MQHTKIDFLLPCVTAEDYNISLMCSCCLQTLVLKGKTQGFFCNYAETKKPIPSWSHSVVYVISAYLILLGYKADQ